MIQDSQVKKYSLFSIGFLLGIILVWKVVFKNGEYTFSSKSSSQLKPWRGQVFYESKEVQSSTEKEITFHRIRLIEEGSKSGILRLEEWGTEEIDTNQEKISKRLVSSPNELFIHLENTISSQQLNDALNKLRLSVASITFVSSYLVLIHLYPDAARDGVGETIAILLRQPNLINNAWPSYQISYY